MTALIRPLAADEQLAFAAARFRASQLEPYLSAALFALVPRATVGLGTFGVDRRWRLYLDPDRLGTWGVERSAGVLLHEINHLLRAHGDRGDRLGVADPESQLLWNVATDAVINDGLLADNIDLPEGITTRSLQLPTGLLEEELYDLLVARHPRTRPVQPTATTTTSVGLTEVRAAHGRNAVDCGSGAGGRLRPHEINDTDEVAAPGLSPADVVSVRARVAHEIRQAGTVPGRWKRWAERDGQPRDDWRRVLRAEVRRATRWRSGNLDPTWSRPDRRADAHPGLILPGVHRPVLEVAVVIDTSGSMTDKELGAALTEVEAIQRQCGIRELWVITCDTEPSQPRRVRRIESIELQGGGGTDLRPALDLLARLLPRPTTAIVLTDGYTPWPDSPPRHIPVVVATTGIEAPPPFRSVTITANQRRTSPPRTEETFGATGHGSSTASLVHLGQHSKART